MALIFLHQDATQYLSLNWFEMITNYTLQIIFGPIIADLALVELSKNISQDRAGQAQCNSINSSLSHLKTIFKNYNGDAANNPGLMKQFFKKK